MHRITRYKKQLTRTNTQQHYTQHITTVLKFRTTYIAACMRAWRACAIPWFEKIDWHFIRTQKDLRQARKLKLKEILWKTYNLKNIINKCWYFFALLFRLSLEQGYWDWWAASSRMLISVRCKQPTVVFDSYPQVIISQF